MLEEAIDMQYFTPAETAKLLRVAHKATSPKGQRQHLAMMVMAFTGTRISQMLALKGEDILLKDGKYVIMLGAAKRGNAVVRTLRVDADPAFDMSPLIELARTRRQSLLFEGLTRDYFNKVMAKYCNEAGLHSSFAHSHVFRHSAAMVIYDATQRIGAVSEFLGHKSPSSAFVYLKENDGVMAQDAMDNLVMV
jgi:integrase